MDNIIKQYRENGYYIAKNVLPVDDCKYIIKKLDNIKTNLLLPFTNIQYGYGNLINTDISKRVTENKFVKDFCKKFYGGSYYYNSLYVHNKVKWVGPEIEWHQEIVNAKTFHPTTKELKNIKTFKKSFI